MAKILLVEDDNNLREIFEMRLQAEGYDTVTAADGEQALVSAMKTKPDLIIADVMMPKLSGFEMLETLRAAPEMADTKVVMMTALGQSEDRTRGERLGVVKYLVKSQVTLEDFVRVVREVLQPDQADAGPSAAPATDSVATSSTTNKEESEQTMHDDTTQQNSPAAGDGGNPISGNDPAGAGDSASSGQMSTADEQNKVDEQVNSFAGGAPTMPSGSDSAGGGSDGSSDGDAAASSPSTDAETSSGSSPAGGSEGSGNSDAAGGQPA